MIYPDDFADKPTELRKRSDETLRTMLAQANDNCARTSGERQQYWADCRRYAEDELRMRNGVTITVWWGNDDVCASIHLSGREWRHVLAGKPLRKRGPGYMYEGDRYQAAEGSVSRRVNSDWTFQQLYQFSDAPFALLVFDDKFGS